LYYSNIIYTRHNNCTHTENYTLYAYIIFGVLNTAVIV